MTKQKKAIIVGASSGIGKGLALLLAEKGYLVAITGRREQLLKDIANQQPDNIITRTFDVCDLDSNTDIITSLIDQLGGLDLFVYSSGTGSINPELLWESEQKTIETNITAFTQISTFVFNYFRFHKKEGHIVCISSIAALRGSSNAPAYNASKAYQLNYLEGLRVKAGGIQPPIHITDIRPGFVDTAMAIGSGLFWVATVEKACQQIYMAISSKKRAAYITRRWRLIAYLLKVLPRFLYEKLK